MSWPTVKISELCEILDNKRKPITKKNRIEGPYPYYGATGILDYVEGYLFDEDLVLIGEDGAKWGSGDNSAFAITGKTWVNNHAHVVKPFRDKILDSWLIYFLNGEDLFDFITGMTVPKLNQGKLKEIPVPLPPITEQKRIVSVLDTVFADLEQTRVKTEQNLKNARELFDSYLQQVFSQKGEGWEDKRLEDVLLDKPRNGWSPPAKNHSDNGIPVLTLSAVTGFKFNKHKVKFTSAATKMNAHYWVNNGDLLITRSNTPVLVGHVAICSNIEIPTIYPDLIMKLKLDIDKVDSKFIYYQLRSERLRKIITSSAQGANPTMKKINQGIVQSLPIRYPSIEIQKEIAFKLDSISEATIQLEENYQNKLDSLNELKKSILQKAFSGELTNTAE
ncbi:restriction endonuclease subunit S [Marinomonas polaris]|uniref:restriction endonuclease subunit S n=1 Tax=Marinomonas polaris TaxID=293552 RepID=UPI003518D38E